MTTPEYLQLKDAFEKKLSAIYAHRERFLEAFIAETGYHPSELVMIQKEEGTTTKIWFELKQKPPELYNQD